MPQKQRNTEYAPDQPKYERGKTVGELREDEMYGGASPGSPEGRARKFLHGLQSDEDYMESAGKETSDVLRKAAQSKINKRAAAEWFETHYDPRKRKAVMVRQSRWIRPKIEAHRAQRRKIIASRKVG